MKILSRSALLLAAFLPLAACDDDSSGPSRLSGTTEFRYSGTFSGDFRAEGSPLSNFETGSYAFGQRASGTGSESLFALFAQQDLQGNQVNNLLLTMENPAVGTVTCAATAMECPFAAFLALGADGTDLESEPDAFLLSVEGTLTITTLDENRARGTFQLKFTDLGPDGGVEVQASSGGFDVPLINGRADLSRGTLSQARIARSR